MSGEIITPLLVFPEGTTTSGTHLIKYKKGAFHSLLPVKPYMIIKNKNGFDTSSGGEDLIIHFIMFQFYFYHSFDIIELPVITPTDKMYEIFEKKNKSDTDKVDIFSEVTRSIMAEAGNMLISNKGCRDSFIYNKIVHGIPLRSRNETPDTTEKKQN